MQNHKGQVERMAQPNLIRMSAGPWPAFPLIELSMFGRAYNERWEDGLTREDRAASGKLRKDIIARKRNFTMAYELADQATVDRMEELYQINDELTLEVTHIDTVNPKKYTVLMAPFSKDRLLAVKGGLWEGLSVEFREV